MSKDTNAAEVRRIITKALKEGRDLSGWELERIEKLDAQGTSERTVSGPAVTPTLPTPGANAEYWRDTHSGVTFRAYGKGERLEHTAPPRSLGRFVRAIITNDQSELDDHERRALAESSGGGAYTVPAEVSNLWFDLARGDSVVSAAGARTIPVDAGMGYTMQFTRVSADANTTWTAENGTITASDPTLVAHEVTFGKCATLVKVSRELMQDSPFAAEMLESILANALASELDRVALEGSNVAPEPGGVFVDSNVAAVSMGTNGAVPSADTGYVKLLAAAQAVNDGGYDVKALISNPRTFYLFNGSLRDTTKQPQRIGGGLDEVPWYKSKKLSSTQTQGSSGAASSVYMGDFERGLAFVVRQAPEVFVTPHAFVANDQVALLATVRADILVCDPNALCRLVGVTAS